MDQVLREYAEAAMTANKMTRRASRHVEQIMEQYRADVSNWTANDKAHWVHSQKVSIRLYRDRISAFVSRARKFNRTLLAASSRMDFDAEKSAFMEREKMMLYARYAQCEMSVVIALLAESGDDGKRTA
jgi:hypothetical protein